jgi:hypothetical protein
MFDKMQTKIPQAMRDLAAKNIDQARAVYNQFLDSARKAQKMMIANIPSNFPSTPALQGLDEAQERAMRRQNVDASFTLADELAKATDFEEIQQIQGRHAQLQMQAYALQAREFVGTKNNAVQELVLTS